MVLAVAHGPRNPNDASKKQTHWKKGNMTRPQQFIVSGHRHRCWRRSLATPDQLHGQPKSVSSQKLAAYAASSAFPGNATPEKALQSLGWAAGNGDFELLRKGVTPEIQKMLHDRGGPNMASHAMNVATQLGGAKVLRKVFLSEEQVLLSVQPEGKDSALEGPNAKSGWQLEISGTRARMIAPGGNEWHSITKACLFTDQP